LLSKISNLFFLSSYIIHICTNFSISIISYSKFSLYLFKLLIILPLGINAIDCWGLPLLNSLLLLSAGFIITWAHHSFIQGNKDISLFGMIISVILIIIFLGIQYVEYTNSEFTIADSVYGTVFFSLTGLHGLHVMAAVILISVAIFRIYCDHITSEHA
jgi:cytochrome c oxidase subunit 3